MGSHYGRTRNLKCPVCKLGYDDFRCGLTFKTARREIISIAIKKSGETLYGRRHGVLGYLHERKKRYWRAHVDACLDAAGF